MADEITVTLGLSATKGELKVSLPTEVIRVDMAGSRTEGGVQDIGTTYEALSIGSDFGTAGYARFKNLDTTNYVEVGLEVAAAFHGFLKLLPGDIAVLRLATDALFARANTAAVKLQFELLEA